MIPKAIIFDLDDTLYLEIDYVRSGFHAVAVWAAENTGMQAEAIESEFNALFDSGRRTDTFNAWLVNHRFGSSYLNSLLDIYRNHFPKLAPLPDVLEALPAFASQYALGLVSDGRTITQQLKWQALGLAEWFNSVVFSDTLGREHWKPHPLPFTTAARQMSIEPRDCIYVGDNPAKDFVGARAAGMASVRIRRKLGLHYDAIAASGAQADVDIFDLSELLAAIAAIN